MRAVRCKCVKAFDLLAASVRRCYFKLFAHACHVSILLFLGEILPSSDRSLAMAMFGGTSGLQAIRRFLIGACKDLGINRHMCAFHAKPDPPSSPLICAGGAQAERVGDCRNIGKYVRRENGCVWVGAKFEISPFNVWNKTMSGTSLRIFGFLQLAIALWI